MKLMKGKEDSMKIYKGHELIKAIADGQIKERNKIFRYIWRLYIQEK